MFKLTKGINQVGWVYPPIPASSLSQPGPASGIRGHARRLSDQVSTKCLQRANTFIKRVERPASYSHRRRLGQQVQERIRCLPSFFSENGLKFPLSVIIQRIWSLEIECVLTSLKCVAVD
ncbi:hypothetical protein BpHYR1_038234 [Brachionus plicatilis]|uniref:Uncharacterized protein n=1 Tax=Brachionus plicatilis TaxID=10195 RepID=A0A3M7Q2X6_BRAPC|nr:hypothetical protein BpHYR1_038234 [Brachionus plicatilis]